MSTVFKQIYGIANDILKETLGEKAPTIKDSSDFATFAGKFKLEDNEELKDALWSSIINKVRKTYVYARSIGKNTRNIRKDKNEWGLWYEELSVKVGDAVENASYIKESKSPFDVSITSTVTARYFKAFATWEHDDVITDRMLVTAFNSAATFGALISALFIELENAVEKETQDLENLTIATAIAGVLAGKKATQCRNLLAEYNTNTGASLKAATCLTNKDFLAYVTEQLQIGAEYLWKEYSTLYNLEGERRISPKEHLIIEVLTSVEKKLAIYLRKDTFHDNILNLPNYTTVNYWQSGGQNMDFAECSRVNIKNETFQNIGAIKEVDITTKLEIDQSGIIAVMRDDMVCASVQDRITTKSIYNPRQERTNYFKKAECGFGINMGHNMVVYYIADLPPAPAPDDDE